MKKHFLTFFATLTLGVITYAQSGFNIGGSIGFPVNDSQFDFTFGFTVDANYLFELNPIVALGPATGYGHGFGDSYYVGPFVGNIEVEDYQYVPVALAGRIKLNSRLVTGADLGYAIAVSDIDDGGFYFRPMIGFNLNERFQLNANYVGISDYYYWSTVNLGFSINL
ncbi:hypothetical protein SAMN04487989_104229 [Bizionia echini]|uniref:Outer membrane protein beta-barrel domain-containing protein n=1 Tax=Bizionia echini TaxID=649333 RepID=A0A1I5C6F5_9FLAO|nr:outer membrane beta-barrel protein [Bizionia echini]MBP93707.1 hypothetical protein [Flavobacteriaceae bacterium]SFN82402.1 hypothetical protein SAMN04487989_104229 [Bizionia echini]